MPQPVRGLFSYTDSGGMELLLRNGRRITEKVHTHTQREMLQPLESSQEKMGTLMTYFNVYIDWEKIRIKTTPSVKHRKQ